MVSSQIIDPQRIEKIETKKIKFGYWTIYTEIIIEASSDQVWEVLTDTKTYPQWASFMQQIDGNIQDNHQIDVYFLANEKKNKVNKIHHTISVIDGREFSWSEPFMLGMIDHHRFIVEPMDNGKTKFIQSDLVKAGLAWLLGKSLIKFEKRNYPKFNRSLKAEVERRYNQSL